MDFYSHRVPGFWRDTALGTGENWNYTPRCCLAREQITPKMDSAEPEGEPDHDAHQPLEPGRGRGEPCEEHAPTLGDDAAGRVHDTGPASDETSGELEAFNSFSFWRLPLEDPSQLLSSLGSQHGHQKLFSSSCELSPVSSHQELLRAVEEYASGESLVKRHTSCVPLTSSTLVFC